MIGIEDKVYEYTVDADMGSVRIKTNDVAMFFNNGYGDGKHKVIVDFLMPDHELAKQGWKFAGHFEVLPSGKATLMDYDCGGNPIHTFHEGRYPVWNKDGDVFICKWK